MNQIKVKPAEAGVEITLQGEDAQKLLITLLEPEIPLYSEQEMRDFRRTLATLLQLTDKDLLV